MDHAGDARGDDRHPDQHGRQVEIGLIWLDWDWGVISSILEWSDKIGRNMSELDVVAICLNLRLQVPLLLQLVARRCETV